MNDAPHTVRVIDLDRERRRRRPHPGHTLILLVTLSRADAECYRQLAVADTLTAGQLRDAIRSAFAYSAESAPWSLNAGGVACRAEDPVGACLGAADTRVRFTWGLWIHEVLTVDVVEREAGDPWVCCLASSPEGDVDAINTQLSETTR